MGWGHVSIPLSCRSSSITPQSEVYFRPDFEFALKVYQPFLLSSSHHRSSMSSTVPRLVLILEPDNPCNTNMYDEQDGRILYQVMTEYNQEIITKVRNMNGDTIASWQWRESRSDIITLGSAHPMSLNTWLKKSIIPFNKESVSFCSSSGPIFMLCFIVP